MGESAEVLTKPQAPPRMLAWVAPAKGISQVLVWYILALGLWTVLSIVQNNQYVMPSPIATFKGVVLIATSPVLATNILLTLYRNILGVVLSAAMGLAIVVAARYVPFVRQGFLNFLYPALRTVPALSIALIALVWFGLGTGSVVFVVLITVLPIYLVQLWENLKVIDATLVEMASAVSRSEMLIFRKLVLPMLVPGLFSATKLGFSVGFKLALVGELLAAADGMGYRLFMAIQEMKTELTFAWSLIVMIIVIVFEFYVFNMVEKKYIYKWQMDV